MCGGMYVPVRMDGDGCRRGGIISVDPKSKPYTVPPQSALEENILMKRLPTTHARFTLVSLKKRGSTHICLMFLSRPTALNPQLHMAFNTSLQRRLLCMARRVFVPCSLRLRSTSKYVFKKINSTNLVEIVQPIVHLLSQQLGAVALACEALPASLGRSSGTALPHQKRGKRENHLGRIRRRQHAERVDEEAFCARVRSLARSSPRPSSIPRSCHVWTRLRRDANRV